MGREERISAAVLKQYPEIDETLLDQLMQEELNNNHSKLVVLDDDPTGVQTVHDVSVFTDWSQESMLRGFEEENRLFYILTNSRGMTEEETARIHKEILDSVENASRLTGTPFQMISRGDSTLRGHYPLETEILRQGMETFGGNIDGEILLPFFREGGRYTINQVHYVKEGEELVPAAQTEFAKDRTFGYANSYLPAYIEEKTKGKYPAAGVTCISLLDLRAVNLEKITAQLLAVENFGKVCVDSIADCDLKVFCIALYRAIAAGKRFVYRTAAGFVKVMGGVSNRPLLTRKEMCPEETTLGGVIVVGSHTAKTTAQLQELLTLPGVVPVEFHSSAVLEGEEVFQAEIARCVAEEERLIREGKTAVCFTERKLLELPEDTKESALLRSVKISSGVQRLVGDLKEKPAFVIAKGGITSSDVGTKALHVKRARVLGQIRPGIPVWQTGADSKFPGIPYVIFPGNVGETSTLREAAEILIGE